MTYCLESIAKFKKLVSFMQEITVQLPNRILGSESQLSYLTLDKRDNKEDCAIVTASFWYGVVISLH